MRMNTKESPIGAAASGKGAAAGYAIGLSAAAVLSLTGILIAIISREYAVPALLIALWRDAFTAAGVAAALLVFAPARLSPGRKNLAFLAANGGVLVLFNITWTLSVVRNGAAVATLLVYCSGGFTVILGRLFLGERIGIAKAAAVAASLLGAALVSGVLGAGRGAADIVGIIAGLASGLAYAAYSLVGKGSAQRGISPWTGVCHSFGFAALVLLALRLLPEGLLPASVVGTGALFLPGKPAAVWILLALLAAGPTAVGFGLYNASLAALPAGTANLVVSTEPVFTTAIACAFLGERLGPSVIAGAALILGAVVLLWLGDLHRSPRAMAQRRDSCARRRSERR